MSARAKAGFSVLEALAAVAIVALALLPIMTIEAQIARQQNERRIEHAAMIAQQNALAILRDMNASQSPQGVADLGDGNFMRWSGAPLSQPRRSVQPGNGEGSFEVVLWRLEVEIFDGTQTRIARFSVDKLGWRRLDGV